jgi:hypothetical protein
LQRRDFGGFVVLRGSQQTATLAPLYVLKLKCRQQAKENFDDDDDDDDDDAVVAVVSPAPPLKKSTTTYHGFIRYHAFVSESS